MFYIYANGKLIFQPLDENLTLLSPKLTLEMGKAGSLQFQIPPSNKYYNFLNQLTTIVTVEMDDVEIFRGRVLSNNRSFNNVRTVYCEGNLAYLVDSVQQAEKYNGTAHELFRKIIAAHNARVESEKQFTVGEITVENREVLLAGQSDDIEDAETGNFDYKQIAINSIAEEWQTSFDYIEGCLVDYIGGYLRTRYENGTTYIDYLADYNSTAVQEIEFGKNMLDLTEEVSAEDVFTVLIPLGDKNLTIASVNGGSDELVDADAVARYGRIVKTQVFDSVTDPSTLLENGRRYLENNVNVPVTITIKAIDMHLVDPDTSGIFLGDKVHVTSIPHDILDSLTCTKIEYDIANPANNTYTFGTPKQSLTERYRKDKQENEAGGGGGGGGGGAGEAAAEEAKEELKEFYDAWINVNPEQGHIDLGALYEKYSNSVTILKNEVGIDLDAGPDSGNVNIRTLRNDMDEAGNVLTEQAARIELVSEESKAGLQLIATDVTHLGELEAGHYATLSLTAQEHESAIAAKADKVTVQSIQTELTATKSELTDTQDVLTKTCGISLDASGRNSNVNISTLKQKVDDNENAISANSTDISSISTSLRSQITLEATHHTEQEEAIAAIKVLANQNGSLIKLKADKTYVDSEILAVDGKIEAAKAEFESMIVTEATIKGLISDAIDAYKASVVSMTVNSLTANVSVSSPTINAGSRLSVGGCAVATQEWTDLQLEKYASLTWIGEQKFATQSWVEDYFPHSHAISCSEGGGSITITIGTNQKNNGTASFRIASTQAYLDGVEAARIEGWDDGIATAALSAPDSKTLDYGETLTINASVQNSSGGTVSLGTRTYIAPSDRYDKGFSDGEGQFSLKKVTLQGNSTSVNVLGDPVTVTLQGSYTSVYVRGNPVTVTPIGSSVSFGYYGNTTLYFKNGSNYESAGRHSWYYSGGSYTFYKAGSAKTYYYNGGSKGYYTAGSTATYYKHGGSTTYYKAGTTVEDTYYIKKT